MFAIGTTESAKKVIPCMRSDKALFLQYCLCYCFGVFMTSTIGCVVAHTITKVVSLFWGRVIVLLSANAQSFRSLTYNKRTPEETTPPTSSVTVSTAQCKSWCSERSEPWEQKCTWKKCAGCGDCTSQFLFSYKQCCSMVLFTLGIFFV